MGTSTPVEGMAFQRLSGKVCSCDTKETPLQWDRLLHKVHSGQVGCHPSTALTPPPTPPTMQLYMAPSPQRGYFLSTNSVLLTCVGARRQESQPHPLPATSLEESSATISGV